MVNLRNKIIKLLGGYTKPEYLRVQRKYQALMDSKTNEQVIKIVNENIYMILKKLDGFARSLWKVSPEEWCDQMYNVINNNFLRLVGRYLFTDSCVTYKLDTTLINKDQFKNVLLENKDKEEALFILENDNDTSYDEY